MYNLKKLNFKKTLETEICLKALFTLLSKTKCKYIMWSWSKGLNYPICYLFEKLKCINASFNSKNNDPVSLLYT